MRYLGGGRDFWGIDGLIRDTFFFKLIETTRTVAALGMAAMVMSSNALADPYPVSVLRVLDKVTARSTVVEVPLQQPLRFGTLEIVVRHCDKRPPEEPPESAAFLEIWEIRKNESVKRVFEGWMFASTPGLSALEHPVYDVWVLDCVSNQSSEPADSSSETSAQKTTRR